MLGGDESAEAAAASTPAWVGVVRSAEPSTRVGVACLILRRLADGAEASHPSLQQWQGNEMDALARALIQEEGFVGEEDGLAEVSCAL